MRITSLTSTARQVQNPEPLRDLLRRWMVRAGYEDTVKGRAAAGERLGLSHQTVANYLAGDLPHPNRIPALAAALAVGASKLRLVIERERHGAKASSGSSDAQATPTEVAS